MSYIVQVSSRIFHFKQEAKTSRGSYHIRRSWFVTISDPEHKGIGVGECAPLPDLSCDALSNEAYEEKLRYFCQTVERDGRIPYEEILEYPSMLFGIETALLSFQAKGFRLFDTPFSRGEQGIAINGLIWMGTYEDMLLRIREKIEVGFTCIKLKIGAIDFHDELRLMAFLRAHFSPDDLQIRVDANGAFSPDAVFDKLAQLSAFHIHSIEQPVRAGNWELMAEVCRRSPIPVALDEELIGINSMEKKESLLACIRPHYIILKPSLHGGMYGTRQWMDLAAKYKADYWFTSALESNIGLNAIAQWCAKCVSADYTFPQGLGTGLLFTDNLPSPLYINKDKLWYKVV